MSVTLRGFRLQPGAEPRFAVWLRTPDADGHARVCRALGVPRAGAHRLDRHPAQLEVGVPGHPSWMTLTVRPEHGLKALWACCEQLEGQLAEQEHGLRRPDVVPPRLPPHGWFRFQRAIGGHANDGDGYVAWIVVHDPVDRDRIHETLGLREPGMVTVLGEPVYVGQGAGGVREWVELFVADTRSDGERTYLRYTATEEARARCERLDHALQPLADLLIVPRGSRVVAPRTTGGGRAGRTDR